MIHLYLAAPATIFLITEIFYRKFLALRAAEDCDGNVDKQ